MQDGRVQVKENGQVHHFAGVEQLVFEAEALNFVKVKGNFFRVNLIYGDSCDWLGGAIMDLVESKRCFARVDFNLSLLWLKLPGNFILGMGHEANEELTENVDFLLLLPVVFMALFHRKPECLTHNVVEWDGEEVAAKGKQDHAVNAVELAPLSLLVKCLINPDCLPPLLDGQWQCFLKPLSFEFLVDVFNWLQLN